MLVRAYRIRLTASLYQAKSITKDIKVPSRRNKSPYDDPLSRLDPKINVYVDKILKTKKMEDMQVAYGEQLRELKGKWLRTMNERRSISCDSLILEIGCHFGHSLEKMARINETTFFLGFDITFKRVYKAANRARLAGLKNIASGFGNCSDLTPYFNSSELDGVVIFFPDPWEKKERQQKHRLINDSFVSSLIETLKPGGFLWLKTDHQDYFQSSCTILNSSGLDYTEEKPHFAREPYTSCFEEKFTAQGVPTNEGFWVKPH